MDTKATPEITRAHEEIVALVPPDETVILVDDQPLGGADYLPARHVLPFLERDGLYWGPPPGDEIAVWELERLRQSGAGFIVFAWPAFWWLDHYPGLLRHLNGKFHCLLKNERVVVFDLRKQNQTASDETQSPARPNDAAAWEEIKYAPLVPVTQLSSPAAHAVADLTETGDVLLEAGCGSGKLSAELATVGRVIELCDFGQRVLDRAAELFELSRLPAPRRTLCDLTKPLPWAEGAVDTTWSSGVLEHWTDEELLPIVREMARISRKCVISLVPSARCLFYRLGKQLAETKGRWPYGRELPRSSLQSVFEQARLHRVREYSIWPEWGPKMLGATDRAFQIFVEKWWASLPKDDPVKANQGYLLHTVGYVKPED
jgi:SAM-dependent methyltransferase